MEEDEFVLKRDVVLDAKTPFMDRISLFFEGQHVSMDDVFEVNLTKQFIIKVNVIPLGADGEAILDEAGRSYNFQPVFDQDGNAIGRVADGPDENFETIHVLVWQSLIIFFTVMLWILWVSTIARGHEIHSS